MEACSKIYLYRLQITYLMQPGLKRKYFCNNIMYSSQAIHIEQTEQHDTYHIKQVVILIPKNQALQIFYLVITIPYSVMIQYYNKHTSNESGSQE